MQFTVLLENGKRGKFCSHVKVPVLMPLVARSISVKAYVDTPMIHPIRSSNLYHKRHFPPRHEKYGGIKAYMSGSN